MNKEKKESRRSDPEHLYRLSAELFGKQARFGAAGAAAIRRSGKAKYRTVVGKHRIAREGWSIVATQDLNGAGGAGHRSGQTGVLFGGGAGVEKTATRKPRQSRRLEDPAAVGVVLKGDLRIWRIER